jgi:glucokinase
MARLALAVDIGGTSIKFGLIDQHGQQHGDLTRHPVPFCPDGSADMDGLFAIMQPYVERASALCVTDGLLLGISMCGNIDEQTGEAVLVANLHWRNVPFGARLQERFGLPYAIATDVGLAALAELEWGVGRGLRDFGWVTIGTGYGGYLVLNGQLYKGHHGFAGNFGHTPLGLPDGILCGCGQVGCLETYVAGPAIARSGQAAADSGDSPMLRRLANGARVNAEMVFQAEQEGDPAALAIIDTMIDRVARNLAGVVNLLDLELLVFGGGVVHASPTLLPRIEDRIRTNLMTIESRRNLRVVMESFPNSALFGAAVASFIKAGLLDASSHS